MPVDSEEEELEDEMEPGDVPVFNPARKIHFPHDFLRFATEAAGFLQKEIPASVPMLNADLVVGDADDVGGSVDRRYPPATSFPQAFQRPFCRAFRSSVSASALNAVEATEVPEFHELINNGTPLPDQELLTHGACISILLAKWSCHWRMDGLVGPRPLWCQSYGLGSMASQPCGA